MFLNVEFGKILKKDIPIKHLEPIVIFALLKWGEDFALLLQNIPYCVCKKIRSVSSFFNVTKDFRFCLGILGFNPKPHA